jgi:ribosomal protein S18 acetylase RimI-like enzyme
MPPGLSAVKNNDIRIELLQPAAVDPMIDLIASVFSAAEPPSVAMSVTSADLSEFLQMLAPRALEDGLTVIARSSGSRRLVGALLTDDLAVPPPLDPQRFSHRFLPIFAMLESMDQRYCNGKELRAGEHLHLFMLAVDPGFGGQGIAQRMVGRCVENGARKGYRWAVTEATGVVSQRVFGKLGFEERFRIRYRDFQHQDQAVFAGITQHDGAALMVKELP